jgi:hypothetical protein
MAVGYPVALDSDYAIWQAFANRFWPAVYIADAQGRVRHHQFGEGGYAECEMVIQRLLGESGRDNVPHDLVSVVTVLAPGQARRALCGIAGRTQAEVRVRPDRRCGMTSAEMARRVRDRADDSAEGAANALS